MREANRRLLVEGARIVLGRGGADLDAESIERLERHAALVAEWGRALSLTAIREERQVVLKHILDSLAVLAHLPAQGRVVDLGSGAGFPGIPIKVARPALGVCLLEPAARKAAFLATVLRETLLVDGIEVVAMRAEEASREPRLARSFDAAVARAFGPLLRAAGAARGLLRVGGWFVAMLGPSGARAVDEGLGEGWDPVGAASFELPFGAGRRIVARWRLAS